MQSPTHFAIIDDIDENRFFLTKSLLRKYPEAKIDEYQEAGLAVPAIRATRPSAVIVHRALDADGVSIIRTLREALPKLPIVMVSGRKDCPEAVAAGANAFLNYDAWLRIGVVVEEVLSAQMTKLFTQTPWAGAQDYLGWRKNSRG